MQSFAYFRTLEANVLLVDDAGEFKAGKVTGLTTQLNSAIC